MVGIPPDADTRPLASAEQKVHRASVHIGALWRSVRRSLPTVMIERLEDLDLHGTRARRYGVVVRPATRRTWGLIIGDVVANLRAALEHVAWSLAQKGAKDRDRPLNEDEARDVIFPIVAAERAYRRPRVQHALELMPAEAHPEIKRMQPFRAGKLLGLLASRSNLGQTPNRDAHDSTDRPSVRNSQCDAGWQHRWALADRREHAVPAAHDFGAHG